jgi:hypothetical protein
MEENLRLLSWPRGQCARRAMAEAKQHSQRSVMGWVTKIYYLELLRASESKLSRWSRLHLQSYSTVKTHLPPSEGSGFTVKLISQINRL